VAGTIAAKNLLSTRDAAARVGVHERTLRRYIACGQIACRRLPGGHYRIAPEEIDSFLRSADAPARTVSGKPARRPARLREPRSTRQQGTRPEAREYDLSPANLARLRARVARTGGVR
jgi:excisionase family DNA binding protein